MKSAKIMFGYAGLLIAGGVFAFSVAATGGAYPLSSLIFTIVPAIIMIAFGIMAGMYHRNHKAGMIGIHAGLVLPLLLGAAYAWRSYQAFSAEEPKLYLAATLGVLAVGSFVALALLLQLRPKPEDRT